QSCSGFVIYSVSKVLRKGAKDFAVLYHKEKMMHSKYMNYERTTYDELKKDFLASAFGACRAKFHRGQVDGWMEHESEWGYASYDFESGFHLPIEKLMIHVINTITNAGRIAETHRFHLCEINNILSKYATEELFADLNDEEKEDFLYDLEIILDNQLLEIVK
ncbi:hypothetical protein, partial [Kingella kingae]|uniref:hypothetical protein n=3 Tax=Kingella kingae TaxID=504 RepID=UPI002552C67F